MCMQNLNSLSFQTAIASYIIIIKSSIFKRPIKCMYCYNYKIHTQGFTSRGGEGGGGGGGGSVGVCVE